MFRSSIACSLVLVALCCMTPFARAVAVVYTSTGTFDAAVGGSPSIEDFNAGPPVNAPFTNGIITVSDPNGGDSVARGQFYSSSQSVTLTTAGPPPTIQFSFSSPITGIGFDIFDLGTVGPTNLSFVLSNGDAGFLATAFTGGTGNQIFRGVTSSSPFNSISLTNSAPGDFIEFDNARYPAAAAVVPLPAAVWCGFALIGGIGAKRARSRRKSADELTA